jgi:cytochrome b
LSKSALVWDLPLRIFHWLFACTVLASWYTSDQDHDLIEVHIQLGYFALGLLIFRIIWGVVGTKHARFISFIPKPKQLLEYIKSLKQSRAPTSIGHNPLGSLMVILMIILISLQAISGLFINDDVYSAGPYNAIVSKDVERVMAFLHHHVFDYMIAAIALHLLAIFYYVRIKKESLIVPMITGKKLSKHMNDSDVIKHSRLWLATFIIIMVTAFVYWLVVLNVPIVEEYY